ncbi:hypothetical protein C8J57DRAFT_1537680 [Mycena rebaudengoi]|nr:hypothetical protein C8J57DRAFT_1537680 [Mycena rebaudengoi]
MLFSKALSISLSDRAGGEAIGSGAGVLGCPTTPLSSSSASLLHISPGATAILSIKRARSVSHCLSRLSLCTHSFACAARSSGSSKMLPASSGEDARERRPNAVLLSPPTAVTAFSADPHVSSAEGGTAPPPGLTRSVNGRSTGRGDIPVVPVTLSSHSSASSPATTGAERRLLGLRGACTPHVPRDRPLLPRLVSRSLAAVFSLRSWAPRLPPPVSSQWSPRRSPALFAG